MIAADTEQLMLSPTFQSWVYYSNWKHHNQLILCHSVDNDWGLDKNKIIENIHTQHSAPFKSQSVNSIKFIFYETPCIFMLYFLTHIVHLKRLFALKSHKLRWTKNLLFHHKTIKCAALSWKISFRYKIS